MLKIIIKNKKNFELLSNLKYIKSFFVYDITKSTEIEEAVFYNKVISLYSNNNNTSKTTYGGRFVDLNNVLLKLIDNRKIIKIHDVAISSGVTTADLYNFLINNNINAQIDASDSFSTIEYYGDNIKYFFDTNNNLIQIYFFRLFLGLKISNYFFISKLFFLLLKISKNTKQKRKKIFLFDKEFHKYYSSNQINYFDFDLFDINHSNTKYDFIRVMNVLNLIYFTNQQIIFAVKNLIESLEDNGIILIGRTSLEGINNATFYTKNNNKLISIKSINNGYEHDSLINDLK